MNAIRFVHIITAPVFRQDGPASRIGNKIESVLRKTLSLLPEIPAVNP